VASIPFEEPAPSRRVALAWRQGYTRPQAIEAIIRAVGLIENPSYRHIR
jgi:LysR family hydrogen peroxide-inducible transcriptional activator